MTDFERRPFGVQPVDFRMPEGTRVGAVRLQVRDLDRSIEFYRVVLGLRVLAHDAEDAALGHAAGAGPTLIHLHGRPGALRVPRRGAYGLYHFALLLPDRPALGRFASHLSRLGLSVGTADHRVSESIYLSDPDGLGIEVYADRPAILWERLGRELVMTTDPLDVESLIAAAGGAAWDGAPAGTTVGHVHLQVGDLDAAEGFYHRAVGLDMTVWSYPGARFFAAPGYHHHLGTNTWSPGPAAAEDQARLLHWEILVPSAQDASAAAQNLRASGHGAESVPGGFSAADPWGTELRILEDRERD